MAFYGDPAKVMCYLTFYLTKCVGEDLAMGRRWGVWDGLPEEIICTARLKGRREMIEFLRRVRRWAKRKSYLRKVNERWRGWAAFGPGQSLFRLLHGLAEYGFEGVPGTLPF